MKLASIKDFPIGVQEVLNLMTSGSLLSLPYAGAVPVSRLSHDLKGAVDAATDQDIKKPLQFLGDVTAAASGEIYVPPSDIHPFRMQFIYFLDEVNLFDTILLQITPSCKKAKLGKALTATLANIMYEDLVACAESRLFATTPHQYFERMFSIYRDHGFPFAWKGTKKSGDFVIFSLPASL